MGFRLFLFTLLSVTSFSCEDHEPDKIVVGDEVAEGDIEKDSTFNGLVSFYDSNSGRLNSKAFYVKDTLHGLRTYYHSNGRIQMTAMYAMGRVIGDVSFFDSNGKIERLQYQYYDLKVGPSIHYKNGEVSDFYFYSLDNEELMHINYDSIKSKTLEQINNNRFSSGIPGSILKMEILY
jgi:antitoxin component YwqK of YwqJK toxin-antitoxin module